MEQQKNNEIKEAMKPRTCIINKGWRGYKRHRGSPFKGKGGYTGHRRSPLKGRGAIEGTIGHSRQGAVKERGGLWARVGGYKQEPSPLFITVDPEVVQ